MRTLTLGVAGMLVMLAASCGMAATGVIVNGSPISFSVEPMQVANRTMVPMRAIFEALGAEVHWNEATQTVTATRGATIVQLTIGEPEALVNGRVVGLEVPALVRRGSTMVPLRFVSEALGADVEWVGATRTVYISTGGGQSFAAAPAGGQSGTTMRTVFIPQGTVVPVALDTPLSSATARLGDGFTVTVNSEQEGDAEFPRGTRLYGVIVGVQKAGDGQPGALDLDFREARLPHGGSTRLDGALISLDDESVTRDGSGRLTATAKAKDDRLLMIGIGAGAGLLIGKLTKGNVLVGGLIGAAAGYLYSEVLKPKGEAKDVDVKAGTVFGVRMDGDVNYSAPATFAAAREAYLNR